MADAMLLRQLLEGLFERGVRVVFTSNRPPEELYERGLNRKYFEPFVQALRPRAMWDELKEGRAGEVLGQQAQQAGVRLRGVLG